MTNTSADAQRWFDRGLNWCFGYHHGEAVACFEKVLEADPNCAMDPLGHRLRGRRAELARGRVPIGADRNPRQAVYFLSNIYPFTLVEDGVQFGC